MANERRYEMISKDLGRHREIPSRYHKDLEDRLAVAFKPQTPHLRQARDPRQPLGGTSRSRETRIRHKRKKAQIVYQYVSENAPHTFLPFILSTSPNACESFDPYRFCQSRKAEREVLLDNNVIRLFASIAEKHGFTQNPEYQNLVTKIFPNISLKETADSATTPLLLGQPEKSVLQFNFKVLLDFLKEHQDGQTQLQITCPYQGVPLP
ncbi:hypothetical protein Alg215_10286 [Pyrenophora tritici-repentis]|nr:hypothetical protein Alg215_10286 [Pyrenophora tritici-repentis]